MLNKKFLATFFHNSIFFSYFIHHHHQRHILVLFSFIFIFFYVCSRLYLWFLIINVLMLLLLLFATCVTRRFGALSQTFLSFVIRWLLLFCVHKRSVCISFFFFTFALFFLTHTFSCALALTLVRTLAMAQIFSLCVACTLSLWFLVVICLSFVMPFKFLLVKILISQTEDRRKQENVKWIEKYFINKIRKYPNSNLN